MKPGSTASPAIEIACHALPDQRCARDQSAPADGWPPAGQLVTCAIIGHVSLAGRREV